MTRSTRFLFHKRDRFPYSGLNVCVLVLILSACVALPGGELDFVELALWTLRAASRGRSGKSFVDHHHYVPRRHAGCGVCGLHNRRQRRHSAIHLFGKRESQSCSVTGGDDS